jgi:hypothetical protein
MAANTVTITLSTDDRDRLLALLMADAPAKADPKPADPKPVPAAKKGKVLTRKSREAFVKANAWAKGMSTAAIREAIEGGHEVKGGWTLPTGARREAIRAYKAAQEG